MLEQLGSEAKRLGAARALVITGRTLFSLGTPTRAGEALKREGIDVEFLPNVEPEPSLETAEKVKEVVREGNYDLVVGIGGGSVLDVAKLASVMATNPGDVADYLGSGKVGKRGLPKILIPTTAGTGSEVSDVSVLTREGRKVVVYSDYLFADVALVDPALTLSMPPKLTAHTGLDALSHAVEAYMSLDAWPVTDTLALKAIELVIGNLREAYRRGDDLEARSAMSLAATMAGIAFVNAGVCLGHALALVLGTKYKLPHGLAAGISLYHALCYNLLAVARKLAEAAPAFGVERHGMSDEEAALAALDSIEKLLEDLNVPTSLSEAGVSRGDVPEIVSEVLKVERHVRRNPRPVDRESLRGLLLSAV